MTDYHARIDAAWIKTGEEPIALTPEQQEQSRAYCARMQAIVNERSNARIR